jgi:hypothetical protein
MATRVQFNSGQKMTLADDFDQVNQQLGTQSAGLFNRLEGNDRTRVTVFASAISYIEEVSEEEAGSTAYYS